jgi:predicted nucleic acid-binding protein
VILVDTSIWVDHFRNVDRDLADLLEKGRVIAHPLVIGELALGSLPQRQMLLRLVHRLPQATKASIDEALHFIDIHSLAGKGIGYVDVHLLASTQLSAGARLWTRDKRLAGVAEGLGLAMRPPPPLLR